ncbi:MAG: hypothetical protein ACI4II_00050 [Acutalibacteraceae bacterium]
MTLQEIQESDKIFLVPTDVAAVLGMSANSLRLQAQQDSSKLGFPVIVAGTRVRIPRVPFLNYIGKLVPEGK